MIRPPRIRPRGAFYFFFFVILYLLPIGPPAYAAGSMWIRRFGADLYWFNPHSASWDRYSPADADAALSGMVGSSGFWANYLTQIDIGDSGLERPVVWSVDEAATFDTGAAAREFLLEASADPLDETTVREALAPAGEWAAVLDAENSLTSEALGRLGKWDEAGNWVHPYDFGYYEGAMLKTETDVLDIVRFDPVTFSYVVATQEKTSKTVYGYSTEYWGAGYYYTGSVRVLCGDIEVFEADPAAVLDLSSGILLEPDLAEGFVSSASREDLVRWADRPISSSLPGLDLAGPAPLVALNVRSYVSPPPPDLSFASAAPLGTANATSGGSAPGLAPASSATYTAQPITQGSGGAASAGGIPGGTASSGAVPTSGSGSTTTSTAPATASSSSARNPAARSSSERGGRGAGAGLSTAGLAIGAAGAAVASSGGLGTGSLFAGSGSSRSRGETFLIEGAVHRPGSYRAETFANALHAAQPLPSGDLARVRISYRDGRVETLDLTEVLAGRAPSLTTSKILRVFVPHKETESRE